MLKNFIFHFNEETVAVSNRFFSLFIDVTDVLDIDAELFIKRKQRLIEVRIWLEFIFNTFF